MSWQAEKRTFLFYTFRRIADNLILDPIFIFGWFGLPRMETAGAALATVIGQFVGCLAGMMINKKVEPGNPVCFYAETGLGECA